MPNQWLECVDCGNELEEGSYVLDCPRCEGLLDVKFGNWCKEKAAGNDVRSCTPFAEECFEMRDCELDTPLFHSTALSNGCDLEVWVKNEVVHPTGTWKEREGLISMLRARQQDVSDLVLFSSGNTGVAVARAACLVPAAPRLHLVVPDKSLRRLTPYQKYLRPPHVQLYGHSGSNDECIAFAKRVARENGYHFEGGFRNYARREGLKTLGLEIALQSIRFDWYVQAVASGIGIYSFHKAFRDLGRVDHCPKILGVQSEVCAPMANAWRDGSTSLEDRHIPSEIAPSEFVTVLRTRNPRDSYRYVQATLRAVGGAFEKVPDSDILAGLREFYREPQFLRLFDEQGVVVGLEAAAALGGLMRAVRSGVVSRGSRVVLNVSGAAKPGDVNHVWIADLLS